LLKSYIRKVFDVLEIRNRPLDEEMCDEFRNLETKHRQSIEQGEIMVDPADLFVSYKREDRETIKLLVQGLEGEGEDRRRVWFDSALMAGEPFRMVIAAQIRASTGVMPVWSTKSVESNFVLDEASAGQHKLVPVKIEAVDPPFGFGQHHTLDLVGWDGSYTSEKWTAFKSEVVRWLRAHDDKEAAGQA
jgi:hypothetical protein